MSLIKSVGYVKGALLLPHGELHILHVRVVTSKPTPGSGIRPFGQTPIRTASPNPFSNRYREGQQ
jgi:hypothetical protein